MSGKSFKAVVKIALISLVLTMAGQISPAMAGAVGLTVISDTFERLKVGIESNQTIQFTSTSGVVNGNIIEIQYPAGEFLGFGKFQLGQDDVEVYNVTDNYTYTDDSTSCGGAEEIDVAVTADNIRLTFCPGSGGSVTAGDVIKIYIGAFVAETTEDGDYKLTNPFFPAEEIIRIYTGPVGLGLTWDEGKVAVPIVDDDQVQITATVDPSLTFDIDTTTIAMPGTESAAPYSVAFGTLNPAAVNTSNNTTINSVYLDFTTNATSGGTVTVQDVNAGLTSVAVSKTIASASVALSAGTEGYGICYSNVSNLDTLYPTYNTTLSGGCTPTKHKVGALQTTPQDLIGTSGPNIGGRVEVLVKVAISNITPAANDYTDTVTFIATGTF